MPAGAPRCWLRCSALPKMRTAIQRFATCSVFRNTANNPPWPQSGLAVTASRKRTRNEIGHFQVVGAAALAEAFDHAGAVRASRGSNSSSTCLRAA